MRRGSLKQQHVQQQEQPQHHQHYRDECGHSQYISVPGWCAPMLLFLLPVSFAFPDGKLHCRVMEVLHLYPVNTASFMSSLRYMMHIKEPRALVGGPLIHTNFIRLSSVPHRVVYFFRRYLPCTNSFTIQRILPSISLIQLPAHSLDATYLYGCGYMRASQIQRDGEPILRWLPLVHCLRYRPLYFTSSIVYNRQLQLSGCS